METIAKSDIFFLLTGGSVILVTLVILVALYYVIKILKDIEEITDDVKDEGKAIVGEVRGVRLLLKNLLKKLKTFISPTSKKTKRKSKK